MNKSLLIGIALVILLLAGYLAFTARQQAPVVTTPLGTGTPVEVTAPEVKEMAVSLSQQNDSGETGIATLVEANGQVVVTLAMQGFPEETPQPAHIHVGACPNVGTVKYPLTNVVNGKSVTALSVTLAQLKSEVPLGINVHKSAAESGVYTACADLEF